ncbi:hypothetical protein XENOCAPTIV_027524, partial [Xenoophorus captivus]
PTQPEQLSAERRMSRRRLDSRSGLSAGLLGETQTPISSEPLESGYEVTGELGRNQEVGIKLQEPERLKDLGSIVLQVLFNKLFFLVVFLLHLLILCLLTGHRGKFAVVKRCVEKTTGKVFAAKFLRKRRRGRDCRAEVIHEMAVLEMARNNPRVVNLYGAHETDHDVVLVLE